MAVPCMECGLPVDDPVVHRASCARSAEPAPGAMDEDAWFLHVIGGRRFGPLTIDEIRAYFTSGMVRAQDRVAGPGTAGPLPAADAAAILHVRAPDDAVPPGAPTAPMGEGPRPVASAPRLPGSVGSTPPSAHASGLGWRGALLWMAVLFAVQMSSLPAGALGATHSLRTFVAAVLLRYLGVLAVCVLAALLFSKLVRGKGTVVKDALLAMTLVHAVLLGNRFLRPPPAPAPAVQEFAGQASKGDRISVIRTLGRDGGAAAPPAPESETTVAAPAKRDWFGEGRAMGERGDWEAVLKHSTEWTLAEPDEPAAWTMLGLAYDELRQPHQAVKVYRHSLYLDPTSHITWNNLGGVYEGLGQYQDAVNAHAKALQIEPRYANAWNNLGIVHARTGQGSAAIEAFNKAVELDPTFVKAWNNLGLLYLRLDRPVDAIATFRKVLEIAPGNADAVRMLSQAHEMERRMAK